MASPISCGSVHPGEKQLKAKIARTNPERYRDLAEPTVQSVGKAFICAVEQWKIEHRGDGGVATGRVVEVVADYGGDTFRAVYTVRFAGAIYVLHVFQKKSKSGSATPQRDVKLIEQRLREAERIAKGTAR